MYVSFTSVHKNPQYKQLFTINNYLSISLPYVVLNKDGTTRTIYGIAQSGLIKNSILKPDFIIVKIEPDLLTLYKESKRKLQKKLLDGEKIDLAILPETIKIDITKTID